VFATNNGNIATRVTKLSDAARQALADALTDVAPEVSRGDHCDSMTDTALGIHTGGAEAGPVETHAVAAASSSDATDPCGPRSASRDDPEHIQIEHAYIESFLEKRYAEFRASLTPRSETFRNMFDDISPSAEEQRRLAWMDENHNSFRAEARRRFSHEIVSGGDSQVETKAGVRYALACSHTSGVSDPACTKRAREAE
jgi:hypothetical protein